MVIQAEKKEKFLQPEIRDGWKISAEMKKVWKVQMELLEEFITVCEEHGFQYWAIGGTLLGGGET